MNRLGVAFGQGLVAYLAAHGSAVTLRGATRHGCCGGTVAVPVAEAGAPAATERYEVVERDGVRVFIERELAAGASGTLTIGVEGFARWRALWVEGLAARMA